MEDVEAKVTKRVRQPTRRDREKLRKEIERKQVSS